MFKNEDPYSQGFMVVGIVIFWVLAIVVFTNLEKPVFPVLWDSVVRLFS